MVNERRPVFIAEAQLLREIFARAEIPNKDPIGIGTLEAPIALDPDFRYGGLISAVVDDFLAEINTSGLHAGVRILSSLSQIFFYFFNSLLEV